MGEFRKMYRYCDKLSHYSCFVTKKVNSFYLTKFSAVQRVVAKLKSFVSPSVNSPRVRQPSPFAPIFKFKCSIGALVNLCSIFHPSAAALLWSQHCSLALEFSTGLYWPPPTSQKEPDSGRQGAHSQPCISVLGHQCCLTGNLSCTLCTKVPHHL